MKEFNRNLVLIVLLFSVTLSSLFAQETQSRNSLGVFIGHAHLFDALDSDGKKMWKVLPSWGIDYDYSISEKWKIGIHSDWVVENFALIDEEGIVQERSRPLAALLSISNEVVKQLNVCIGGGVEMAPEEDFYVVRLGLDYGWVLSEEWELKLAWTADYKIKAYYSFFIGLGVAKSF